MRYHSGMDQFDKSVKSPIYPSGDSVLDELLGGGFRKDLIYLLYGDRTIVSDVLLTTTVHYLTLNENHKAIFVDGNNRFNPYRIAKLAVTLRLSPSKTLESILIARAFTYEQMIELLEHKVAELNDIGILLISGLTNLWPNYELHTFEELLKAIDGIKKVILKFKPLIIMTAPLNPYSDFKPVGGHHLSHFGNVLVKIMQTEREVEYSLIQHPFLPERSLAKRISQKPKKGLTRPSKNTTLDSWLKS